LKLLRQKKTLDARRQTMDPKPVMYRAKRCPCLWPPILRLKERQKRRKLIPHLSSTQLFIFVFRSRCGNNWRRYWRTSGWLRTCIIITGSLLLDSGQ